MAKTIWLEQQAELSLTRLLPRLEAQFCPEIEREPENWQAFVGRLRENFEPLFKLLFHLYGSQYDFFYHLEQILATAARMWLTRPAELKGLDAAREDEPLWFQSQHRVGGVCYVDLFAGNLN
jgi:amylosucrase/maltose alpha-D-glucosyltransferase/alpha-amylase